jgi:hypothetical protein
MFEIDETWEQREARIERELLDLMSRHHAAHISDLPRGAAKTAGEHLGREAPNVYVRLMFADKHIANIT